jgi:hypothetical protein
VSLPVLGSLTLGAALCESQAWAMAGGLAHEAPVPVGLEPVALAARSGGEVWVGDRGTEDPAPAARPN